MTYTELATRVATIQADHALRFNIACELPVMPDGYVNSALFAEISAKFENEINAAFNELRATPVANRGERI
jgi:hypothetical protein